MRLVMAVVALIGTVTVADAGCLVPHFRFSLGSDSSGNMVVTRGSRCTVTLRAGGSSAFESVAVSAPPGHGTVTRRGSTSATYQPQRGFHGEDSFAITVSGQSRMHAAASTIRISVTVE
jgi:hypothetical protein